MWILSFDATCHAYTTRSTSPATLAPTQPSVRHPPTNLTPLLPTPPPFYHTTQQLFPDTHTQAPLLPLPTTPYLSYLCLVPTPGTPRNRTPSLTALTRTLTNTNTPPTIPNTSSDAIPSPTQPPSPPRQASPSHPIPTPPTPPPLLSQPTLPPTSHSHPHQALLTPPHPYPPHPNLTHNLLCLPTSLPEPSNLDRVLFPPFLISRYGPGNKPLGCTRGSMLITWQALKMSSSIIKDKSLISLHSSMGFVLTLISFPPIIRIV
ncbi:hypothetical protein Pcinc_002361 [Petrolisthes cinctipes]|uniref:Uncharacterized protein n=1 Tax=Petrolisthes cinctipes TaxID=88211 RepID=A0AAE1GLL7_PETCI|nr:hypothetical protein Pcinc_002361 [Petrolisthes cinctipes]